VDYRPYRIKDIRTSIRAPNMNAYAERFVRSVRQEALDNFIIVSREQAKRIVREYVEYYNHQRPHQGIGNDIPDPGYRRWGCDSQSAGPWWLVASLLSGRGLVITDFVFLVFSGLDLG
jgi:transposase InsO family protein